MQFKKKKNKTRKKTILKNLEQSLTVPDGYSNKPNREILQSLQTHLSMTSSQGTDLVAKRVHQLDGLCKISILVSGQCLAHLQTHPAVHVSRGALPLSVVRRGRRRSGGGGGGGRGEIRKNIKCKDRQCLVVFCCHFFLGGGGAVCQNIVSTQPCRYISCRAFSIFSFSFFFGCEGCEGGSTSKYTSRLHDGGGRGWG